jgi:serine/threonine-protein kinase RsbW
LTYHQTSEILIPTDPTALKSVLAWFDQFQTAPIPHKIWLQCQLALIEGVTNAVRHAHAGLPPTTQVRVEVSIQADVIDICIWDQGPGFDLKTVLKQKLTADNREADGGRGLKIMYLVADRLTYDPCPGQGNCLRLKKTFDPPLP